MNHSFADHGPGMSFKGAMAYYMHDRKEPSDTTHRTSSDRVAWTSTRNLATDRPDVATAVMVATAKDANRLKKQAGIRASGRKAKTPVKTFALSWHPDEAASLDRAEMERAANAALEAVGMEKHQAIIVCHNDTRHPHVHVVVNRVNPETGKLAKCGPSENRALDRWAYEYERDRGNIVSPNRAAKHQRQDRLRQRYSAEERRNYVRRKHAPKEDVSQTQKLRKRSTEQRARHKQEWADLSERYQAAKRGIRDDWRVKFRDARREFNRQHKGLWKQYGRDKWRRRREFKKLDSTFYGRLSLSIQAAQMQRASGDRDFKNVGLARLTWINLQKPELRNATIGALEKREFQAFKRWHDRHFQPKLMELQRACSQDYHEAFSRFETGRSDLIARQQAERRELRSTLGRTGSKSERQASQNNRFVNCSGNVTAPLEALRAGMQGNETKDRQHSFSRAADSPGQSFVRIAERGKRSKATDALSRLRSGSSDTRRDKLLDRER